MISFEIRKEDLLKHCIMATAMTVKFPVSEQIATGIRFDFSVLSSEPGNEESDLTLSCTNLQNSYFGKVEGLSVIYDKSFWVVESRALLGAVKAIKETAIIHVDEQTIVVEDVASGAKTTIPTITDETKCQFPTDIIYEGWDTFVEDWQQERENTVLGKNCATFERAIRDLKPMVQQVDPQRTHLYGVLFDKQEAVATDGHRMAVRVCKNPVPFPVLEKSEGSFFVATPSLQLMQKFISPETKIVVEKDKLVLCDNEQHMVLSVPFTVNTFPPWREVVPEGETQTLAETVNASEMKNLLAESMAIVGASECTFVIDENSIEIKSKNMVDSMTTRKIPFESAVEEKTLFNAKYLKDAFETLGNDENQDVWIFLGKALEPMTLEDVDGNKNVIMPLR